MTALLCLTPVIHVPSRIVDPASDPKDSNVLRCPPLSTLAQLSGPRTCKIPTRALQGKIQTVDLDRKRRQATY